MAPNGNSTVSTVSTQEAKKDEVLVEFVGSPPYGREFHRARTISKSEFAAISVESESLSWSAENGWRVKVPASNTLLLEYFRGKDSGFKVRDDV